MSEIKVTQADREAAADLIEAYWQGAGESHDQMRATAAIYRAGHTQGVWAYAFARHRSDACASVQRERDALREMLEMLRKTTKIEAVSNGQWALHFEFGIGEANCERMRKFSDDLHAFLSRYEGEVK